MTDTSRYAQSGVTNDLERQGLPRLLDFVRQTFTLREGAGKPLADVGYYANILDWPGEYGLAVSTDGVGTKILIAEMMERYDTIAQDAMAMNVNDVLCVGAEPVAFLNYLGIDRHDPRIMAEIGKGLLVAARESNVSIPGGETAQVAALLGGVPGKFHFDLIGTAMGIVRKDRILMGAAIRPGDVVVGLASSGLHSNGYTLARRVLLDESGLGLDEHIAELGETLGEALLRPTLLYVKPVVEMLKSELPLHAINHITGQGFLNLLRVAATVEFHLTALPGATERDDVPALAPIFGLLQAKGGISAAEMYEVFNMGVGMVLTMAPEGAAQAIAIAREHGHRAWRMGEVRESEDLRVSLPALGLAGTKSGWL